MSTSLLSRLLSCLLIWGAFTLAPLTFAAAQQDPAAAEEPDAAPEAAEDSGAPVATYEDVLFVEALPEVPASNTLATKLPLSLLQTPASVGVVSEPLIEQQAAHVLGDALANVSGLHPQTQSGVADLFVVRGFDSVASGLVLTDGAVEPEISFYQLYNVERIEVLKGPGGFLYGPTPTAGTVNLVRKQPADGRFLTLDLDAGSFGTYGAELDVNSEGGGGDLGFRLNGLFRQSDGFRDRAESEVTAVNPAFTWRPGGRSRVNINVEVVDSTYTPDAGLPIVSGFFTGSGQPELADVPRERSYGSPFDFSDQRLNRAQVDVEHAFSDRFTLRNKVYHRDLDWQSDGTIVAGLFPELITSGELLVARVLTSLDDRQRLTGNQLEGVLTIGGGGGVEHRLLAGFEVGLFTDEFTIDTFLLPVLSLANPVETAQRPLFPLPGQGLAADAETRILAPYLIDQIRLSDRFQVSVGGRFDVLDYEDPVSRTERDDSKFSPLVGLVWSPSSNVSLYASGTQAFAPPSSRTVGERRPEESNQAEVGVKARLLDGRLESSLALYQLERDNVAIPDDNGVTQQTGSQRSRGLELDLAARLGSRARALFSYAYTDAELTRFAERVQVALFPVPIVLTFDRSGNDPAFAPEHLARLWVSHELGGGLTLAGGARYVGEQFVAEDNLFALDDALTFDAAVAWDRGPQRFSLNFKNITDEEYETRGFGGSSVIPADGFAVIGSVGFRAGW